MNVLCNREQSILPGELHDSRAMAIRILEKLASLSRQQPSEQSDRIDVEAHVAVFIALKTECVHSPMSKTRLARLTGLKWRELRVCESHMLGEINWRLYEGALTCTD